MEWQYYDGAWRCNYRGAEMYVVEISAADYQWQTNTKSRVYIGYSSTLFVSKRRAEEVLRPKMKSTASFSRMRRRMICDVGTSEPFWYERISRC